MYTDYMIKTCRLLSPCRLCKGAWGPVYAGREQGKRKRYPPHRDTARSPFSANPTATPPLHTAGRPPGTEELRRPGTRGEAEEKIHVFLVFKPVKP